MRCDSTCRHRYRALPSNGHFMWHGNAWYLTIDRIIEHSLRSRSRTIAGVPVQWRTAGERFLRSGRFPLGSGKDWYFSSTNVTVQPQISRSLRVSFWLLHTRGSFNRAAGFNQRAFRARRSVVHNLLRVPRISKEKEKKKKERKHAAMTNGGSSKREARRKKDKSVHYCVIARIADFTVNRLSRFYPTVVPIQSGLVSGAVHPRPDVFQRSTPHRSVLRRPSERYRAKFVSRDDS